MFTKLIAQQAHLLAEEVGLDSSQEQVVQYSLTILTTTVFGYLAIAIGGWLTGAMLPALVAACSASLLRIFSGGAHASTPLRCVLSGGVIFACIGWLAGRISPEWLPYLLALTVLSATVSLGLYAPADTPGKPITSQLQRKTLLKWSFVSLFLWALLITYLSSSVRTESGLITSSILGIGWQTLTITPLGYQLIHYWDDCLAAICKLTK